jgi:hypothetical protein
MRCLLHIGTEKTGSSYLQCVLALARDRLLQRGLWFAEGAPFDEKCMKSGRISGGNALRMAEEIGRDEWDSVRVRLNAARDRASDFDASGVVISSELLLRPLSTDGRLSTYVDVLHASGFSEVKFLLVLRHPADQLLSLYKHRAKVGTAGDLSQWCECGYQVPEELAGFRCQVDSSDVNLTVRRYERSPGKLDRILFEDWLGIPTPQVELPATVNPSLTLSELLLIRQMAKRKTEMVEPLYAALAEIPQDEKARGRAQETYARAIASQTVAAHAEEWAAWNERLPESEKLTVPDAPDAIPACPHELALSERQMLAISELLGKAATPEFIAKLFWRSQLRPALGRIKRTISGSS